MPKKATTEQWVVKAIAVHGDRYDYSKVVYSSAHKKVIFICREHGEFEQSPTNHLCGKGCGKCSTLKQKLSQTFTTAEFLSKAIAVHGDSYNYDKVVYVKSNKKVIITCRIHGDFKQTPNTHNDGKGCYQCGILKLSLINRLTTEEFIVKSIAVHGNKYDYSKVKYENNHTKVTIICPIHGEFEQVPMSHLDVNGCPYCGSLSMSFNQSSNQEQFIEVSKFIHLNKYNYSKVNYVKSGTKVTIICPIHGEFQQLCRNHLFCNGCPNCSIIRSEESFLERQTAKYGDNNILLHEFVGMGKVHEFKCKKHNNKFKTTPSEHLRGIGVCCSSCNAERQAHVCRLMSQNDDSAPVDELWGSISSFRNLINGNI